MSCGLAGDALAGGKNVMTDDEAKAVIWALQPPASTKSRSSECRKPESAGKQETSDAFLAAKPTL